MEAQPRTMERENSRSPKAHLEAPFKDQPYVQRDVFDEVTKAAIIGGFTGLFAGGVRNAMARENIGLAGMVTRQAPLVGMLTATPVVYCFVNGVTQNLLGRNDAWGAVLGGFTAGCVLGMPCRLLFPAQLSELGWLLTSECSPTIPDHDGCWYGHGYFPGCICCSGWPTRYIQGRA